MRAISRCLLVVFVLFTLAGCAGLRPGFEPPTVNVQGFRAVPSERGMPAFEIDLAVANPNANALKLAGIAYTVSLDGDEVVTGVGNKLPEIPAYGAETFTVTAQLDLLAGAQFVSSLLRRNTDRFDYEFEAKLDPGPLIPSIRVRDTGTVSLDNIQGF
ncbi:MAG: LEA type 2 family protein [Pseudomonadota bacterium]